MAMLRLFARESAGVRCLFPPLVVIDELTSGLLVELCEAADDQGSLLRNCRASGNLRIPLIGEHTRHGRILF